MAGPLMDRKPGPSRASPLMVAKAVFWSFLGIRQSRAYQHDAVRITPLQVVIGGLVGALLFVLTLLGVVWLVTH
jgi:hypothetical protein